MKLGLIADIHCDVEGLRRAMTMLEDRGVDAIWCAGDLVEKGRGCDGDAVVDILRQAKIPCVKGNHDNHAAFNQQWIRENLNARFPKMQEMLLEDRTLNFLANLPETITISSMEKHILMAHGTPGSLTTYLYACTPRSIYERIAEETQADVIILGHTHRPMNVRFGHLQIINPGSVCGEWIGGSGTCGVLDLEENRFEVYDLESLQRMNLAQTVLD
jgi:putative phosphoesterase